MKVVSLREIVVVSAVLAAACTAPSAREPDPLDVLTEGRAHPGTGLERSTLGDLRPVLGVGTAMVPVSPVGPDGRYEIADLPAGRPLRSEVAASSGIGLGPARRIVTSPPRTLPPTGDPSSSADIGEGDAPPVVSLRLETSEGGRSLVFPRSGLVGQIVAEGFTPEGERYGGVLRALEDPALVVSTTRAAVATVSSQGRVTAGESGRAWVEVTGEGEWAELPVVVDFARDTDGDGMPDSFEVQHGLDPGARDDSDDLDGDGLSNGEEFRLGTRPDRADTDGDQLTDFDELRVYGTDPLNGDTDGDQRTDQIEVADGTDPTNPNDYLGSGATPQLRTTRQLNFWTGKACEATPGDLVYVLATDGTLILYRVDPLNYFTFRTDQIALSADARDLAADGASVFVAGGSSGLEVVDASLPENLRIVSRIATEGTALEVAVAQGTVYVASTAGLEIFRPGLSGAYEAVGLFPRAGVERVSANGHLVALGIPASRRVVCVDVTDATQPVETGSIVLPASAKPLRELVSASGVVYAAHGPGGLVAISTEEPGDPRVVGTTAGDGYSYEQLAFLGNMLAAYSPQAANRVRLFRLQDDGRFDFQGDGPLGLSSAVDLSFAQNHVFGLDGGSFSVVSVLPEGDRAGAPPGGTLLRIREVEDVLAGQTVTVTARPRDDVYVERVLFYVDGRLRGEDSVPPYRLVLEIGESATAPEEILVNALAVDLAGLTGPTGRRIFRVVTDVDADGIPDSEDTDRDGDTIEDLEEELLGDDGWVSDPELRDTDGDTIEDGEEVTPGVDGYVTDPSNRDTDGDGLDDDVEITTTGTDPTVADSDGNGILDGDEDSDGDGLSSRDEILLGTDPAVSDSDGDGLGDGVERDLGLDPTRQDSDGDGTLDGLEDGDDDGLPNAVEVSLGTDPGEPDTDGDGLDDGTEAEVGTDPARATDYSTVDLAFRDRTVTLRAPLVARSLLLRNAVITAERVDPQLPAEVELEVLVRLTVDAESSIDVSGGGYPGGRDAGHPEVVGLAPEGVGRATGEQAGGSHGGTGGRGRLDGASIAGEAYGDFRYPRLAGGGGSAPEGGGRGGAGGGVARIRAAELYLDGSVLSNGIGVPLLSAGGGGAGGSIRIESGRLTGTGRIEANGGATAASGVAGGGGGGRIAVYVADLSGFDTSRIRARGATATAPGGGLATAGGAGTVYLASSSDIPGLLRVENGGLEQDEPRTILDVLGSREIAELGDDYLVPVGGLPPASISADIAGLEIDPDIHDGDASVVTVLGRLSNRILTEPGLLALTAPGARFQARIRLDALDVRGAGALYATDGIAVVGTAATVSLGPGVLDVPELFVESAQRMELTDARLVAGNFHADGGSIGEFTASRSDLFLESGLSAGTVSFDSSVVTVVGDIDAGSLLLEDTRLSVPGSSLGSYWPLVVDVAGEVQVDATSSIDLGGKGLVGGYGLGNDSASGECPAGVLAGAASTGGSHGGRGGDATSGGEPALGYGDYENPTEPGSGGNSPPSAGAGPPAGNGGGVVYLHAGRLLLDGVLDASGGSPPGGAVGGLTGGGGGGTVVIEADVLEGDGAVTAHGGDVTASLEGAHGGAGGGGRIALVYGDLSGFGGSLHAAGGRVLGAADGNAGAGGPGTVFLRAATEGAGELHVDGEGAVPRRYRTRLSDVGASPRVLDRLFVRGGAFVESDVALRLLRLDPDVPTRFTLAGGLKAPRLELPQTAEIRIQGGELDVAALAPAGGSVGRWTLSESRLIVYAPLRTTSLNVTSGSVVTVPEPTAGAFWPLEIDVVASVFIDSESSLDVAGKGYVGGGRGGNEGPWGRTADHVVFAGGGRTGGSHGGLGGYQGEGVGLGTIVAPTFDDFQDPRRPGGGGSAILSGGEVAYNGGGLVRLSAGTLLLYGRIDAQGEGVQMPGRSSLGGAGAGGSVAIFVDSLLGPGEVRADGGWASRDSGSGGGGGGRIAVYYTNRSLFTGGLHAAGGGLFPLEDRPTSAGGAGTVFLKSTAQVHGDLLIDNNGLLQSFIRTQLRPVGAGTIESLGAQFLTASMSFPLSDTRLEGQWVVLDGQVARAARIVTNTEHELQTDPASGDLRAIASSGAPFRGAILLDSLRLEGSAAYSTQGDLVVVPVGGVVVEAGSTLDATVIER